MELIVIHQKDRGGKGLTLLTTVLLVLLQSCQPGYRAVLNGTPPDGSNRQMSVNEKPDDPVNVLAYDASNLLNEFLIAEADKQFSLRQERVSDGRKSAEGTAAYIETVRSDFDHLFDMTAERTPLNAVVTRVIHEPNYRIENILFESLPNHYITANLYIPTFKNGPFPAVLEAIGHATSGKAQSSYQSVAALFALNGFVALVIDTYGQGEMDQIRNADGSIAQIGPTETHTQLDIGAMIVGTDLAAYQAWHNIRGIDYLMSRPEVDGSKIGMTGNSGGGTQTLFMLGLDPRIQVAAPSCGLQTRERMLTLNGPGDGCHHLYNEGGRLIGYADYLLLAIPKPVLVLAAERDDIFDINAVSRTVREAKWFYKNAGYLDHLDLFSADDKHGYHQPLRESAVWWFKKHLLEDDRPVVEPKVAIQSNDKLQVTTTGQVLTDFKDSKSIVDLNRDMALAMAGKRKEFWDTANTQHCISRLKEMISYSETVDRSATSYTETGEIKQNGVTIKKMVITSRDGFPLPALLFIPPHAKDNLPASIYINPEGKKLLLESRDFLELMEAGRSVLAVDLRGFGETKDNPGDLRKRWREWNVDHRLAQTAFHIGRPLIGQRVQDVVDAVDFLFSDSNLIFSGVEVFGPSSCGLIALHAAAIDPRITRVNTPLAVSSWLDIINNPLDKNNLGNVVPGAMRCYDLSDLVKLIGPEKIVSMSPSEG